MTVEACGCDTCVYKTVAAKLSYLLTKREVESGQGGGMVSEAELERLAAERLGQAVQLERSRR